MTVVLRLNKKIQRKDYRIMKIIKFFAASIHAYIHFIDDAGKDLQFNFDVYCSIEVDGIKHDYIEYRENPAKFAAMIENIQNVLILEALP